MKTFDVKFKWIFLNSFILVACSDNNEATSSPKVKDSIEVKIGTQFWMTKNLNVDKFRNGDPIPQAKTDWQWKKFDERGLPAWCYYKNDSVNGVKYGKLYNWHAVKDPRGLAPKGFHIPKPEEWAKLCNYLGGEEISGLKMKSRYGWDKNGNGTNESGFNGLPGGFRDKNGRYNLLSINGYWWSASTNLKNQLLIRNLFSEYTNLGHGDFNAAEGFSVRCLRD